MKATYNKSKIMRNAWYLKRANASMSFSACLRKAWRNEKLAVMTAIIENRPMEEPKGRGHRSDPLIMPGRLLRQQQNLLRRLTITGGVPPLNTYYGN